jgi:hypothetical protein
MLVPYNVGPPNTFGVDTFGVDKLTERTNVANGDIFKGLNRNFFSLRDQCEIKNIFKGPTH